MRCPRCEFENMPGQDKCFKCGSVLEISSTMTNSNPPRMAKWKKPFRFFFRSLRTTFGGPSINIKFSLPAWIKAIPHEGIFAAFLSIIPGLAHKFQGRFREILWYVVAWTAVLWGGLFLYGGFLGMLLFGIALGLHAWIAIHAGLIKEISDTGYRFLAFVIALVGFFIIYSYLGSMIFYNLTGGRSSVTIPYQEINQGDFLLASRRSIESDSLKRGSLVLAYLQEGGRGRRALFMDHGSSMVVQIVGLGGENLEIKENTFFINGIPLDEDRYPVPQWLHNMKLSVTIPENQYFVNAEYNVYRRGRNMTPADMVNVCVLSIERFEAKAFMLWSPLWRRGYITEPE